jgi:hypothetical protein
MSTLKTGKVKTTTIADELDTESTAVTNVINGSAKAWVNFNGTGTVAIRRGFNVNSITDNGTGNYTVNFATAMTDLNYCTVVNAEMVSTSGETSVAVIPTSSSSQQILAYNSPTNTTPNLTDARQVNVVVFN